MKESRALILILLACIATQSFVQAVPVPEDDSAEAAPAAKKGKGDSKGAPTDGKSGQGGTPEDLRENPESAKGYVEHGKKQFVGVQNSVDKHFDKKKKEGEKIHTDGETTQVEAQHAQGRVEKDQYDRMYEGFKYTDKEMANAAKQVDDDGTPSDDKDAGEGKADESKGDDAAPPPANEKKKKKKKNKKKTEE